MLRPRHAAADVGNAEAALPALDRLIADDQDLGVDEDGRVAFALAVGVEHGDEHAKALMHLRRGQADAGVLEHGVDHVVDELLQRRALQLGFVDGRAPWPAGRGGPSGPLSGSTWVDSILRS